MDNTQHDMQHGMVYAIDSSYNRSEDWKGLSSRAQRKKLQNRLNQRARRRRKMQDTPITATSDNECTDFHIKINHHVKEVQTHLRTFTIHALQSFMTGQPDADHLISLLHLNFVRGMTANATVLHLDVQWLNCTSVSPIGSIGPRLKQWRASTSASSNQCASSDGFPPTFAPTPLQRKLPHHPWIDLFPLARMRDNFLAATYAQLSDDQEVQLWNDVVESKSPGSDWAGFIVWGDPWHTSNWEVTEQFLKNWAWLLKGCTELILSTNRWRSDRGELPLDFDSYL